MKLKELELQGNEVTLELRGSVIDTKTMPTGEAIEQYGECEVTRHRHYNLGEGEWHNIVFVEVKELDSK